ncbi:MAG: TrkH family potassium uptake protein [Lachnospiraceae bacterium]|nr:TrkH family potassium uptake protein [Lachnospiraceae bacterium]
MRKIVLKTIGLIMLIEATFMLFPLVIALIYHEQDWKLFGMVIIATAIVGGLLFLLKPSKKQLYAKDGFIIVAIAWIVMSLIGAIPYVMSGLIPNYLNAVFEAVSGFTTSGVTIVADVEIASHAILFWRSLTHWIGGMGVLVFMLALTPIAGGASMHILRAEAPGPTTEKLSPKISQTAKYLYLIYFVLTILEVIALVIAKLDVFHSFLISFGTLATGGFSFLNSSLAEFTMAQQGVVSVFMILAGMNFSLFFMAVTGKLKKAITDKELITYLSVLAAVIAALAINVFATTDQFETFGQALHHSIFAGASALTSTGFAAYDYNLWPWFSKGLLILVMFIGGCAGSTAGGIKVSRFIIMIKAVKRHLKERLHPRSVNIVRFNDKEVENDVVGGILIYFSIFILIYVVSMIIVSLEPKMDFTTTFSYVSTTLNNNGIDVSTVSMGGFANFNWASKIVFIVDMLLGRLEIFPIVLFFTWLFSPVTNLYKKMSHKVA